MFTVRIRKKSIEKYKIWMENPLPYGLQKYPFGNPFLNYINKKEIIQYIIEDFLYFINSPIIERWCRLNKYLYPINISINEFIW